MVLLLLVVVVVGVGVLDGLSQRHKVEGRIGEVLSIVVVVVVVIMMMMIIIMDDTHTQVSSSMEADRSGGEGGIERERERKRER